MIAFVSNVGRVCVVLAAIAAVVGGAYEGYWLAWAYVISHPEQYGYSEVRATTLEAVGTLAGALGAAVVAGGVLGAAATLYLIHDRLRELTRPGATSARGEPTLEPGVRRERLAGRP